MAENKTFMVEDAQLLFRNFAGNESQFNRAGDRNFTVVLDPEAAEAMLADGWNVKYLAAREEGDEETPVIQVAVGYKARPPHIVMIAGNRRTNITEDMVDTLDYVEIAHCDLVGRAYNWEVNGKTGIKAYLQTMFITIVEDAAEAAIQAKYEEG